MSIDASTAADDLHENARRVLTAIDAAGGEAHTRAIRRRTGFDSQLVHHHASTLEQTGLITRTGTADVGAPIEANVYALTDAGEERVATLDTTTAPSDLGESVDDLQNRVAELEETVATLRDTVDEQADQIETLGRANKDLHRRVSTLEADD